MSVARSATAALAVAAAAAAALLAYQRRRRQRATTPCLIFTGTGCSSGLPLTGCSLEQSWAQPGCVACKPALRYGRSNPNYRGNVSALLRFLDPKGCVRHVQIDCGKTFRELTVMGVYRKYGIKSMDALILTHDHADAVGGLDELRSLQEFDPVTFETSRPIRCFCDRRTITRLRHMFPYLFPASQVKIGFGTMDICRSCELDLEPHTGVHPALAPAPALASAPTPAPTPAAAPAPAPVVKRFVARIDWEAFGSAADLRRLAEIDVFGLRVTCLPVMHGADYVCFGYGFGAPGARCVYLSDYTALVPPTAALLDEWARSGIALLVLDALNPKGPHPVHASAEESIELARRLRPRRTLLVGMSHRMEHTAYNRQLRALWRDEGLDVQLAHDGQLVPLSL